MRLAYQKAVFGRAWGLFKARLLGKRSHVTAFIVQTAILFGILYFVPWLGDIQTESRLALAGVTSVLFSIVLGFVWDLIRAPEVIWSELSRRIDQLERFINPKFSVLVDPAPRRFSFGHASRSGTGGKFAGGILTEIYNALAIDVTNETASILEGCEAYLSKITEFGGEDGVFQAIRLPWVPMGNEQTINIPPAGKRTLMVFRVFENRVAFIHDDMPMEMVRLLKDQATYFGIVTLSARNVAVSYVRFRLTLSANEPPVFCLVSRGFGDVGVIPLVRETSVGI